MFVKGVFYVDESKVPKEEPKTESWWRQGTSIYFLLIKLVWRSLDRIEISYPSKSFAKWRVVQNHGTRDQIGSILWVHKLAPWISSSQINLGGGFKYFLFSPLFGEDFQFDEYFSKGLKPPTSNGFMFFFQHIIGEVGVQLDFFWQGDETGLKQRFGLIIFYGPVWPFKVLLIHPNSWLVR